MERAKRLESKFRILSDKMNQAEMLPESGGTVFSNARVYISTPVFIPHFPQSNKKVAGFVVHEDSKL